MYLEILNNYTLCCNKTRKYEKLEILARKEKITHGLETHDLYQELQEHIILFVTYKHQNKNKKAV